MPRFELMLPVLVSVLEDYYLSGDVDEISVREQLEGMSYENIIAFQSYAKHPDLLRLCQQVREQREATLTDLPDVTADIQRQVLF